MKPKKLSGPVPPASGGPSTVLGVVVDVVGQVARRARTSPRRTWRRGWRPPAGHADRAEGGGRRARPRRPRRCGRPPTRRASSRGGAAVANISARRVRARGDGGARDLALARHGGEPEGVGRLALVVAWAFRTVKVGVSEAAWSSLAGVIRTGTGPSGSGVGVGVGVGGRLRYNRGRPRTRGAGGSPGPWRRARRIQRGRTDCPAKSLMLQSLP